MIKYNPKSWLLHILSLHESDTVRILWKEIIFIALLTTFLTYLEIEYLEKDLPWMDKLMAVYSLVGFVLALLLVFRTNTGYDRWWEGRKKWGELVNNTRNLAIKLAALKISQEEKVEFSRHISNYPFALKEHLREGVDFDELNLTDEELKELSTKNHVPSHISLYLYAKLNKLRNENIISEIDILNCDINLKTFSDITGACERIRNTPIVMAVSAMLKIGQL